MKSASTLETNAEDAKLLAAMDDFLAEIATIRRSIKKKDVEIKRLQSSTRRKLVQMRASFHAQKAI